MDAPSHVIPNTLMSLHSNSQLLSKLGETGLHQLEIPVETEHREMWGVSKHTLHHNDYHGFCQLSKFPAISSNKVLMFMEFLNNTSQGRKANQCSCMLLVHQTFFDIHFII